MKGVPLSVPLGGGGGGLASMPDAVAICRGSNAPLKVSSYRGPGVPGPPKRG